MRPQEPENSGQHDLFRSRLDQILDLNHPKIVLCGKIDWQFLSEKTGARYILTARAAALVNAPDGRGCIFLNTPTIYRTKNSAPVWIENPYYQYFCGEEFFCHQLVFDRSSLTRWRQRMGDERLLALLQESLAVAVKTKAAKPSDFTRVIVDTTVAEKNVAFPTDAKLIHRARDGWFAKPRRPILSCARVIHALAKRALIAHQRYAHAKQYKRARKQLRKLKTFLGRTLRDIRRKIEGDEALQEAFRVPLWRGQRVMTQKPRDPLPKIYSLHAPEVECIGKGKSHKPYEFGVKASIATTEKTMQRRPVRSPCHGLAGSTL